MKSLSMKLVLSALGIVMLSSSAFAQRPHHAVQSSNGVAVYDVAPGAYASSNTNSPANTGGGSLGYNQMVETY